MIYPARFLACIGLIIARVEGGYVNDPQDPGGETNYGISKRSYPNVDIAGLTEGEAIDIYYRDFWVPTGCAALANGLDLWVFDCAINSGPATAVKMLQGVCGVAQDGALGPMTAAAANGMTEPEKYLLARLRYYQSLPEWAHDEGGWTKRLFIIARGC
jgi:lysozyme family protein